MMMHVICWIVTLLIAFAAGKVVSKIKLPSILGWLIAGMLLGPHAAGLLPQRVMDLSWYKTIIMWMQCAFGLMLGTELIWKRIRSYGKALVVTTLTQSLGTFALVSLVFFAVFQMMDIPGYLAFAFGGIALATAPAPALSIVSEFHTKGPVTNTLLPMAVLDDIVGIAVFFTVNACIAKTVSGGNISLALIPVMIFMPILVGAVIGVLVGFLLKKVNGKSGILTVLIGGITVTAAVGYWLNTVVFTNITLNYMLLGVAFSAAFSNMIPEEKLKEANDDIHPIVAICLLGAIVDLGAPLDYHLILGAGLYTFIYIAARACGKYFGARSGAKLMKMPETVQKYLGFTLLPHSGVSLVFTGIVCATLEAGGESELAVIVKGTIAAAAVINELIAVIAAKKGFEKAGEISAA
ncbi:MAG: cation:proton antiporter [Lachnospiraceae bacterium]|nr:cation:proton antiporter [Lachnospiraceae bacterium]